MPDAEPAAGVILATLVVYKLVLVGIGVWAAHLNKDESDFFLGGRGLGPWVAGLSYAASTSSAWVLLGYSGFIYVAGVSALWMAPGILAAYVVIWLGFGPRLRRETAERGHVTLSDFLAAESGPVWRTAIPVLAGGLVLFAFVFYIAAQFGAAAIAFESQLGLGGTESVLLGAAVILVYGLLGGFWAVSVTDMVQGAMMAIIAVLLPTLALIAAGGPAGVWATLSETMPPAYLDWAGGRAGFVVLGFAGGLAAIGLGALGQPHLMARLMAVKDEASRRRGFAVAMSWGVIVHLGMAVLALSGRALVADMADAEALFYELAARLLPGVLAGLVIAAVLSAVMSTVDSLLVAASAAAAHDLRIVRVLKGREVLISRIVMATICALAVGLTLTLPATIFDRVLFSWSALGAAFGPVILARVVGVEPRGWAIFASILAGFSMTVVFYVSGQIGVEAMGEGPPRALARLAAIPGDPFERIAPWILPTLLCFGFRQPRPVAQEPEASRTSGASTGSAG
ncbi:sodium/proline symporter [Marinicauda salina]|uniref:Sodium/proline symporter n=1 Tax=Marinicauda salina TaxID=2135793 RepID=A0A2U2BX33_9PROT|nr:sodium/proline symporter [Marinicauda salina]PWE18583.1 sodium/proline symporter [Marinicauda salina]